MPGYKSDGNPNPGKSGDYYCDANDGSDYCWELDVMEANKYVLATTPHSCDGKPGGYASKCDGGGCQTNVHNVNSNAMCPSSSCKIDTTKPFRQAISFGSTYSVKLTQGSNSFEYDACGSSSYIQDMQQALDYGMTLIMSYWGDGYSEMQWLDGMTGCKGDCQTGGQAIFSDIEIS